MTVIDDTQWKNIENDDGRSFSMGLRNEINEIISLFSRRGSKIAVEKEWLCTLAELRNLEKLATSLADRLSSVSFNAYKMIFSDDECGGGARRTADDMARIVAEMRRGIARQKECKTHTQKKSNREFLEIILRHIDDAYIRHNGGEPIKRSWVPGTYSSTLSIPWKYATPPWVFSVIWSADSDFGNNPSAIDKALGRHIKSCRSPSQFLVRKFEEGDAFKWGDSYLVITDIIGDVAVCDIRKTVLGVAIGYEEVPLSELSILEAVHSA